jgi:uncharacterized protein (TIGR02391 family)
MFENIPTCPLTGLSTNGKAKVEPLNGSEQALYSFKPIGRAIFKRDHLNELLKSITNGNHHFRPDLAGMCRAATEKGESPVVITYKMFAEPPSEGPKSFEEKQNYFLCLLYEVGGMEHKKRDILTTSDFPLAFAVSNEEFSRIMESLIEDGFIRYDTGSRVRADFTGSTQVHFGGVFLTPAGKHLAISTLGTETKLVSSTAHVPEPALSALHPLVRQIANRLLTGGHYRQAVLDVYIMLDKAVQQKAQQPATLTGKLLMDTVFSAKNPILKLSNDSNEQQGFMQLFSGAVQAIRNHYAHNLSELEAQQALEWLCYASALFRKVDEAELVQRPATT